jgi:hypothetical protein
MLRETLTDLDDSLRHQMPTTFDSVGVSDHRFTNRYWYMVLSPDGSVSLTMGLAAYPNMNVFDGYACVVVEGNRQLNTRVSRLLRPRIEEISAGPITYTVLRPHQTTELTMLPNDGPISYDLTFEASEPPRLEAPHQTLHQGQLLEDYRRIHQGGTATGSLTVGDRTWDVDGWYADKDHTWGTRSHFGGATIVKGGPVLDDFSGLYIWATWSCGPYHGYIQLKEDGKDGRRFSEGEIVVYEDGCTRTVRIVKAEHNIRFFGNSNMYTAMPMSLVGESGETFEVDITPAHLSFAMIGSGYFDGYNDRRGQGAYRGDDIIEHDEYELFEDGHVRFPGGRRGKPWHRELPCNVTCNGRKGFGHSLALVEGKIDRYGLCLPHRSRQGNGVLWEDGLPDLAPGREQGIAASSEPGKYPTNVEHQPGGSDGGGRTPVYNRAER